VILCLEHLMISMCPGWWGQNLVVINELPNSQWATLTVHGSRGSFEMDNIEKCDIMKPASKQKATYENAVTRGVKVWLYGRRVIEIGWVGRGLVSRTKAQPTTT